VAAALGDSDTATGGWTAELLARYPHEVLRGLRDLAATAHGPVSDDDASLDSYSWAIRWLSWYERTPEPATRWLAACLLG
jgi:hypothetical protein